MSCDDRCIQWYALMVKSRHEKWVSAALRGKGYTEYLPLYRKVERYGGHTKTVHLPLFPNYVFSKFDPYHRLPILTIPGVFCVVQNGHTPSPVAESEIEQIQRLCEWSQDICPWPFGEPGTLVRVVDGPLTGVVGTLTAFKSRNRLVVSISLLQRSVSIEIDADVVRPVGFGTQQHYVASRRAS